MDEPVESGPRWRLIALLLLGLAALAAFIYFPATVGHNSGQAIHLKTFFRDGHGLESNAEVRIAGICIGRVMSVRVRPELTQAPVEVELIVDPGYRLMVPRDSKVRLGRAGILGGTVVDIDVQFAKASAAQNGDVLPALD